MNVKKWSDVCFNIISVGSFLTKYKTWSPIILILYGVIFASIFSDTSLNSFSFNFLTCLFSFIFFVDVSIFFNVSLNSSPIDLKLFNEDFNSFKNDCSDDAFLILIFKSLANLTAIALDLKPKNFKSWALMFLIFG